MAARVRRGTPSVFAEMYHRYYEDVFRRKPDIQINEDDLMHDTESHFAQYVQIDGAGQYLPVADIARQR